MARRKRKKKKTRSRSHDVLLVLMGSVLTLCVLSVTYGFLIRKSMAGKPIDYRIEVLNGTGETGLARQVAAALRMKGIDVFNVDDADSYDYEETILIARKKGVDLDALGQTFGCRNQMEQIEEDSFVDATLIIGADYRTLELIDEASSDLLRE